MQEASLAPSFVWTSAAGAVSYEYELAKEDPSFGTVIVSTSVTATGYTYTARDLDYDTNYYWRVRSVAADGTKSAWSAVQNFHTESAVVTPTTTTTAITTTTTQSTIQFSVEVPSYTLTYAQSTVTNTITNQIVMPDDSTPAYIWAIVAIGALLTIAVIVLIIRTRRVV
jgi:hypothetical protein